MTKFKAARNRPFLGPDGGSGGQGGDVYLVADPGFNTLSTLRYKQVFKAANGGKGGVNNRTGAKGEDCSIKLPLGTAIYDQSTGALIGELTAAGDRLMVCKGGGRGLGNIYFTSSIHRAPTLSTKGHPGETKNLRLELKLIADVGLAGWPNAGKSSLVCRISAARPAVADYPFTTIDPCLGVVQPPCDDFEDNSFVVADIPGLIEGAGEGRGLGFKFLKHLERTRMIAYVIDAFSEEEKRTPLEVLADLKTEIGRYDASLLEKPGVIILNKRDLAPADFDTQALISPLAETGYPVFVVSCVSGAGLPELLRYLGNSVKEARSE